jgi:hypothetical protein
MAANKITWDNYRWAVRYTYRSARRTRAGRLATGLLLGPFDPALYACVRQLRETP